ncbi:MAG: nucleoside triphosphate hydrolase [Pseudomonadota bacterium]
MTQANPGHVQAIVTAITAHSTPLRVIAAIAGQPASGKSTLAAAVVSRLNASKPGAAALVPMDGFHLDNSILEERGLRARKGAPQTFDVHGLIATIERLRANEEDVYVPVFDRERDIAIANARCVPSSCPIVVVEGNYLLLDEPPWSRLGSLFDLTVRLHSDINLLKERLIRRWLDNGLAENDAWTRTKSNDLPNALLVSENSAPAQINLE